MFGLRRSWEEKMPVLVVLGVRARRTSVCACCVACGGGNGGGKWFVLSRAKKMAASGGGCVGSYLGSRLLPSPARRRCGSDLECE